MSDKLNVGAVARVKLCNTCGACSGICPSEAVHFEETTGGYLLPVVDEKACTRCGLCFEVCPGIHFGKTLKLCMPEDPFAGHALEAFVGKAADRQLFDNSQSGGIVSALLEHALECGRIRGAVTVSMQPGSPPRPVTGIAQSRQELLGAQKSKYCPVPVLGFLRDLRKNDGPVAVVGTSCQIHGLKNVLDRKPKLGNRIAFTIGLVCDRVLTYSALDYLVGRASIKDDNKDRMLYFRDKSVSGYPGDVHVLAGNDKSVVMPATTRMQVKDYFTPVRCRLCFDKMNVFADITVGDPHGLEGIDRKLGESVLISRTESGRKIVHAAMADQAVFIRPVVYTQILKGQGIDMKKEQWHGYTLAWKKSGRKLPDFYEQVRDHAYDVLEEVRYQKDLEYSLGLDDFPSRQKLFRFVEKKIRRKHRINLLLKPLRSVRRIIAKIIE